MAASNFIGSYELKERLGRGSMGDVYRAAKLHSDELVAVKVLRGDFSEDPELLARFLQERTVLVRLDSPALVRVRDLIIEGGVAAIVMDLMDGGDLRQRLNEQGRLSYVEAVALMATVFSALETVHQAGVMHRDIKPANLLFSSDGSVHLADFGIAKLLDQPHFTQTYGIMGTPSYMAPEMGSDVEVTAACDVYSAGIVLFEMTTGQLPFLSKSPLSLMRLHAEADVIYPTNFPPTLEAFLKRALAKDPANRPTAHEAKAALEAMLTSNELAGFSALGPLRGAEPVLGVLGLEELAVTEPSTEANPHPEAPILERNVDVSATQISSRRAATTASAIVESDVAPIEPAIVASSTDEGEPKGHVAPALFTKRRLLVLLAVVVLAAVTLGLLLGTGPASAHRPSAPVVSALVQNGHVVLSWPQPRDSGPPITSYIVSDGLAPPLDVAGQRRYVFSNLVPGTTYAFSVKAVNKAGQSSAKVVDATYFTKPRAPKVLAKVVKGHLKVTWRAAKDNGAPITSYRVSNGVSEVRIAATNTSYTFAKVVPGKTYHVTVHAINKAGMSKVSNIALVHAVATTTVTSPNTPPSTPSTKPKPTSVTRHHTKRRVQRTTVHPAPPTIVSVTPLSGQPGTFSVNWTAPVVPKGYHLLNYTLDAYNVEQSVVERFTIPAGTFTYSAGPLGGGANTFTLVANLEKVDSSTVVQYSSASVTS